jgi:hypothetical protein
MDLIGDLKNEIIISDINIFSLSALELQQWLISNFVQQLYRKKPLKKRGFKGGPTCTHYCL